MTKGDTLLVRKSDGGTFPVTFDNQGECRSCGAVMLWCETPKKKKMPVDANPDADGVRESHWSTCPNADSHRGGGGGGESKPAPSAPKPTIDQTVINGILTRLDAIEVKLGMAADLPFAVLVSALTVFGGM